MPDGTLASQYLEAAGIWYYFNAEGNRTGLVPMVENGIILILK